MKICLSKLIELYDKKSTLYLNKFCQKYFLIFFFIKEKKKKTNGYVKL